MGVINIKTMTRIVRVFFIMVSQLFYFMATIFIPIVLLYHVGDQPPWIARRRKMRTEITIHRHTDSQLTHRNSHAFEHVNLSLCLRVVSLFLCSFV